jgi:hypothetical protein
MAEFLQNPLTAVFGFMTITWVVSTVMYYWYKMRKAEMEASLKQQMIERGMSADEIVRVLQTRATPDTPTAGDGSQLSETAGKKAGS